MHTLRAFALVQTDAAGLLLDLHVRVDEIRRVAPGLDADVVRAGLGPQHQHVHAVEIHPDRLGVQAVFQPDGAALQGGEHQGVHGEVLGLQRQLRGVFAHDLGRAADQVALQHVVRQLLGLRELNGVLLQAAGGRPGLVGAHGEPEGALIRVLHRVADLQAVGDQLIGGAELVLEGEARMLLGQQEDGAVGFRRFHGPLHLAGIAVLGHLVADAVHVIGILLQTAADGEHDRRAAGPEGGIALPQALGAVRFPYGLQLGAHGRDGDRQLIVADRNQRHRKNSFHQPPG